jgi:DNA-binding LytR/AlgR family response regulator
VIDDEPEIRKILKETLEDSLEFEVTGEADNVETGTQLILDKNPDAVFLDIKLRGGDAFQLMTYLRRNMELVPAIILNTGYNDFEYAQKALNEFRQEVIMILQKPFWKDWKNKESEIVNRIREYYHKDEVNFNQGRITIKSNHTTWLIQLADLIFIEVPFEHKGRGKLLLETTYKSFLIYNSLNKIEKDLPDYFLRINRYTIINTQYLSHFDHSEQTVHLRNIANRFFAVGDTYRQEVMRFLEM